VLGNSIALKPSALQDATMAKIARRIGLPRELNDAA
jgi:hypothetical protein